MQGVSIQGWKLKGFCFVLHTDLKLGEIKCSVWVVITWVFYSGITTVKFHSRDQLLAGNFMLFLVPPGTW